MFDNIFDLRPRDYQVKLLVGQNESDELYDFLHIYFMVDHIHCLSSFFDRGLKIKTNKDTNIRLIMTRGEPQHNGIAFMIGISKLVIVIPPCDSPIVWSNWCDLVSLNPLTLPL